MKEIPDLVDFIFVIDDNCPEKTGEKVLEQNKDLRVNVIFLEKNLGVGGATVAGYKEAIKNDADIVVKIDGDGQMDPSNLIKIISLIFQINRFQFQKQVHYEYKKFSWV